MLYRSPGGRLTTSSEMWQEPQSSLSAAALMPLVSRNKLCRREWACEVPARSNACVLDFQSLRLLQQQFCDHLGHNDGGILCDDNETCNLHLY